MTVGRVTEITAISPTSFEDAIREAVASFSEQFRGVREAWLKESRVIIEDGNVTGFQGQPDSHLRPRRRASARSLVNSHLTPVYTWRVVSGGVAAK